MSAKNINGKDFAKNINGKDFANKKVVYAEKSVVYYR